MRVAHSEMLRARIAYAGTAIGTAPQGTEGSGTLTPHVAETVGCEKLIGLAKAMINSDVE